MLTGDKARLAADYHRRAAFHFGMTQIYADTALGWSDPFGRHYTEKRGHAALVREYIRKAREVRTGGAA